MPRRADQGAGARGQGSGAVAKAARAARPGTDSHSWCLAADPDPRYAAAVVSCRGVELVAHAPHDLDVRWPARVALDLLAQSANVHRDRALITEEVAVPDGVEQLVAAERLPTVSHEEVQQVELLGGQIDGQVHHVHRSVVRIQANIATTQDAVGGRRCAVQLDPTQMGPDSGDQLAWTERLDDVVVGADV